MSLITRLVGLRATPVSRLSKELLALYGVEFPASVRVGRGLRMPHRGFGVVVHPNTVIGDNVTIFHGVTIGRRDAWRDSEHGFQARVILEDGVVVCPGAVILFGPDDTVVRSRTIVGANAVLGQSTGTDEIWAGAPARRVKFRQDIEFRQDQPTVQK